MGSAYKNSVATNMFVYMAFVRCYKDNKNLDREKSRKIYLNQLPRQEANEEKKITYQRVIFTVKATQCRQAGGCLFAFLEVQGANQG